MRREYVICNKEDLVAVANVVREKTGSVEGITVPNLSEAVKEAEINLDAEITEQEEIITEQDNIIDTIMTALEGKAAGDDNIIVDYVDITINLELNDALSINMISPIVNENGKITLTNETIVNGATYRFPKINGIIIPFQLEIISTSMYDSPTIKIVGDSALALASTSEYSIRICYCLYTFSDQYSITLKGTTT